MIVNMRLFAFHHICRHYRCSFIIAFRYRSKLIPVTQTYENNMKTGRTKMECKAGEKRLANDNYVEFHSFRET